MKTIASTLFFLIACVVCAFCQNASVEVIVKNIKEPKGSIRIGLFTNQKDFMKTPVQGRIVKATGTEVTVVFENLPAGDYAVSVIHDENENGELDSNRMGIPKEGFAFGNNAMGSFGPPTFEKAKISLNGKNIIQTVNLKYI